MMHIINTTASHILAHTVKSVMLLSFVALASAAPIRKPEWEGLDCKPPKISCHWDKLKLHHQDQDDEFGLFQVVKVKTGLGEVSGMSEEVVSAAQHPQKLFGQFDVELMIVEVVSFFFYLFFLLTLTQEGNFCEVVVFFLE